MSNSDKHIGYSLVDVSLEDLKIDYRFFSSEDDKVFFDIQSQYLANRESQHVAIRQSITYAREGRKPFLKSEIFFSFLLNEHAWSAFREEDRIVLPRDFAMVLVNISIGTCRGILCVKTEATPFSKFYLPPIVLDEIVKEDIPCYYVDGEKEKDS